MENNNWENLPRNTYGNQQKTVAIEVVSYNTVTELSNGPWDVTEQPELDNRYDFGAIRVRGIDGAKLELEKETEFSGYLTVTQSLQETVLRTEVFAAPKSGGLWEETWPELELAIKRANAQVQRVEGHWGQELVALVPITPGAMQAQAMRFIGINGSRWMLRATLVGRGAIELSAATPFLRALSDYVVVRGENAAVAGEGLLLSPLSANKTNANMTSQLPDLLARGPEITEVH